MYGSYQRYSNGLGISPRRTAIPWEVSLHYQVFIRKGEIQPTFILINSQCYFGGVISRLFWSTTKHKTVSSHRNKFWVSVANTSEKRQNNKVFKQQAIQNTTIKYWCWYLPQLPSICSPIYQTLLRCQNIHFSTDWRSEEQQIFQDWFHGRSDAPSLHKQKEIGTHENSVGELRQRGKYLWRKYISFGTQPRRNEKTGPVFLLSIS